MGPLCAPDLCNFVQRRRPAISPRPRSLTPVRLVLYQPDIPQNTGALLRLGACFSTPVDIIEPCGFPFDDRRLRRSAMDYGGACELVRHRSWEAFLESR